VCVCDASLHKLSQADVLSCWIFLIVFVHKSTRRSMNWVGFRHQVQGCAGLLCPWQ